MVPVGTWRVETWSGTAAAFHALDPDPTRAVFDVRVTEPALVLGSMQDESGIDTERIAELKLGTARRRSGGGAVWVEPGSTLWVDIVIPKGDPLWDDDVARSMLWLGRLLAKLIGGEASVFEGRYEATDLARAYCFGGVAPGEVIGPGGKIVGISQRRTRNFARFQCVAYTSYDAERVGQLFRDPRMSAAVAATPVQVLPATADEIVSALVAALPV